MDTASYSLRESDPGSDEKSGKPDQRKQQGTDPCPQPPMFGDERGDGWAAPVVGIDECGPWRTLQQHPVAKGLPYEDLLCGFRVNRRRSLCAPMRSPRVWPNPCS